MTTVTVEPTTTVIQVANVVSESAPLIQANSVSVDTSTTGFIDASTVQGAFEQLGAGALFTSALATKLAGIQPGATAIPDQAGHAGKFLKTDGFGNLTWATGGATGDVVFNNKTISTTDLQAISFLTPVNFIQNVTKNDSDIATEAYVDSEVGDVIPSQTGHTGKFLTTDGFGTLSWAAGGTGGGGSEGSTGNITFSQNSIGTSNLAEIKFTSGADFTNGLQINNADVATETYAQTQATTAANNIIPGQNTHAGKFLTTDGATLSWATVSGGGGTADTGNVIFSGSIINTNDSSDITFGTNVVMQEFTTSSTGIPTLSSGSFLDITAPSGVRINSTPLALVPTQTSHSGKFLTTDGTNLSWATVSGGGGAANTGNVTFSGSTINTSDSSVIDFDAAVTFTNATAPKIGTTTIATTTDVDNVLPSDAGHANKYLKADGSGNLSWSTVSGSTTGNVTFTNSTVTTTDSAIDFDSPVTFTNAADPQINGVDIATLTDVNAVLPTYGVAQANQRLGVDGSGNLEWQTPSAGSGNANTGTLTFNGSTVNTSDSSDITFAAGIVATGGLSADTIHSTDGTAQKSIVSASDFEITAPDGVTANGAVLPFAVGKITLGNTPSSQGNAIGTVVKSSAGTYVVTFSTQGFANGQDYFVQATYMDSTGSELRTTVTIQPTSATAFTAHIKDSTGAGIDTGSLAVAVYSLV
jgi:hypothetical protein